MAKIIIAGDAVVITSTVKLEDYRKVAKYRPKALILMGGEDGKEPVFAVGVTSGAGNVTKYGIEFSGATHDEDRMASITVVNPCVGGGDIKDAVAENLGPVVMQLNKIEAGIPAVLDEINAEKAAIMENISVAQ